MKQNLNIKTIFEGNDKKLKEKRNLVLFNKNELKVLNAIKPTMKIIDTIKQVKSIFEGELVG